MNEAYIRGFVKAAQAEGLSVDQAIDLLKSGESSGMGRYFASKALQSQALMNHPFKSTAIATPFVPINTLTHGIPGLMGLQEMALARGALGNEEAREKEYANADKQLAENSYGQNAKFMAGQGAKYTAPMMGLLGAGVGATAGSGALTQEPNDGMMGGGALGGLAGAGAGGLLGAGAGALIGAGAGGLGGLLNKFIANHTSDESRQRAAKMKTKHPYSTALPFGDMVGAAVS